MGCIFAKKITLNRAARNNTAVWSVCSIMLQRVKLHLPVTSVLTRVGQNNVFIYLIHTQYSIDDDSKMQLSDAERDIFGAYLFCSLAAKYKFVK